MAGNQRPGLGQDLGEPARQVRQSHTAHDLVQPESKGFILNVIVQEPHGHEPPDN
jgi:hypothetical protein